MHELSENARMALKAISHLPSKGIPTGCIHTLEHAYIEKAAEVEKGDYLRSPEETYLRAQHNIGVSVIDQYIPLNPLKMGQHGYEQGAHSATTGLTVTLDDICIDSPEAVVDHMERVWFPRLAGLTESFNEDETVQSILRNEKSIQEKLGPSILKAPYNVVQFPKLYYSRYGYENYFMAFALYPEIMERGFSLEADYAALFNRAAARAFSSGEIPAYDRLDNDMADSRGTLADIRMLDRIWLPHFTRAIAPVVNQGFRLLWHCDGNLMGMVPRLLDAGLNGFQGFQYEDGMDYVKICNLKPKDGTPMFITAGVSVTRTLPLGKPGDVKRELKWLVDNGPKTGLLLACSSSMTPGIPWENFTTLVDGLAYYREHGRN